MKLSTIYRRAAERVAECQADGWFLACCVAITIKAHKTNEADAAKDAFAGLFMPSGGHPLPHWWPVSYSYRPEFHEVQNARVIALLLAAEIASDEERAARKTSRNLKSRTP